MWLVIANLFLIANSCIAHGNGRGSDKIDLWGFGSKDSDGFKRFLRSTQSFSFSARVSIFVHFVRSVIKYCFSQLSWTL